MKPAVPLLVALVYALAVTIVTADQPNVTGQWNFDEGDLGATIGADLQFVSNTASITTFPTVNLGGQSAQVMAFGSNSISQGFYMRHGARPNGGGQFVNQYTLIMDIMFPVNSSGQLRALFQTDPFNHPGNDAEFYIGGSTSTPDANGVGSDGQFNGPIAPNTWYRIAFAVDLTAPTNQLSKYINGVGVGTQSLSGGIDGRYALGPTALLFTAGLTNGGCTQPGFVNSIQFLNGCLTSNAIAALGRPTADGIPPGAILNIRNTSPSGSVKLSWAGRKGPYQVQMSGGVTNTNWQNIGNLDSTGSITIPTNGTASYFRVNGAGLESLVDPGAPLEPDFGVGPLPYGDLSVPTKQIIHINGQTLQFGGRPVDIALSPDKKRAYIKNINNLVVVDTASWAQLQKLPYPGNGASKHGICVSRDGSHIYITSSGTELYDWTVGTNGNATFSRTISLPPGNDPCGLAVTADGSTAFVCFGRSNALARVNLGTGLVTQTIGVGIAPWDVVLSSNETTAYVSDWGGRIPRTNDLIGYSVGIPIVVDSRGIAASGTVSIVDLVQNREVTEIATGLHPSDLELSSDNSTLFVANANSDTVTVIDTQSQSVKETILVRSDPRHLFGSAVNALALSPDGTRLYVACGGDNGIGVVELPNGQHTNSVVLGFLPTDWYPGAIVADTNYLYVANVKGLGSIFGNVYLFAGTADKIPLPTAEALSKYTARVQENGRVPQVLQAQIAAQAGQAPVPVPRHIGEPSVFKHVLYVVKENKTYDQIFGDIPQGNGNSNLCVFPQNTSPNHHALATQFVLLDNYYCNGVYSVDGHSWITEANTTDYWEKTFGGFSRSGRLGDDPLVYSSTGFIWDNVLQHGLTFHNYGLMSYSYPQPGGSSWQQIYADYTSHAGAIWFTTYSSDPPPLRANTSTNISGFNLTIPDQCRVEGFLKEFSAAQSNGVWPTFNILYLPDDHTAGAGVNFPTPRAMVADNDLALGRAIQAVTQSTFWSNTVIFIIEDDPQGGYDHVDGHRSICMVVSPYTKRGQTISTFYNQTGVVHTMEQIMGLPPMNQFDAMSPLMTDCFTSTPDYTPYTLLPNNVPLNEMNPGTTAALPFKERYWAKLSQKQDFTKPDAVNDDELNRIIWHSVRGNVRYPSEWAGPHGKGLKKLGLSASKNGKIDNDD